MYRITNLSILALSCALLALAAFLVGTGISLAMHGNAFGIVHAVVGSYLSTWAVELVGVYARRTRPE